MTAQLPYIIVGLILFALGALISRVAARPHLVGSGGEPEPVVGSVLWRVVAIVLCVGGGYLVAGGLFLVEGGSSPGAAITWEMDRQAALERARAEQRPVFMDFSADWCQACKELERELFSREDVARAIGEYVPHKADMTQGTEENEELQARYGIMGLPAVVLLPPPSQATPAGGEPGLPVVLDSSSPELENPQILMARLAAFAQGDQAPVSVVSQVEGARSGSGISMARRVEGALGGPLWLALLLLFGAGVLSSFTPCVYPLIPITVGTLGALGAGPGGRSFRLALTYVVGMALMYSALGLFAAGAGKLFGSALQSTPVLVGVALVFALMGASMLGAFQIPIPVSLQTKAARVGSAGRGGTGAQRQSGGYWRALVMGLVAGVVGAPCLGPVLVVLLAYIGNLGSPLTGFLLMISYALGLGLLLLVVGTFSGAASSLPKSGPWMDLVKGVFGVTFLILALWYLKDALPILKSVFTLTGGA